MQAAAVPLEACIRLFLCGDVMTGRGIDQILPHPLAPHLYEPYVTSAMQYVHLAERAHGPISRPVSFAYIWGELLAQIEHRQPHARIVNLETAVTTSEQAWPGKGIHYRMHPRNLECLKVAGLHCCVLANNHTLDWGQEGLRETLRVLREAGLATAGAGADVEQAGAPAQRVLQHGRVLIFAAGTTDSGIAPDWGAAPGRAGLYLLQDLSLRTADDLATRIGSQRRPGDVVVFSIHWGGNWGYEVSHAQRRFAHRLVDAAAVDIVHGHSSHHPRAFEVYGGRLILYGCGDLLNDYEGIAGHEAFRPELGLAYFPLLSQTGQLAGLTLLPTRMRRLRIELAEPADAKWLCATLNGQCQPFGTTLQWREDATIAVTWAGG